ncbi:LIC11966 family surface protein [Leptospira stimsonii]|uniref:LIC11966 family surface protein n=1 Tax=Leptospira stimsonii TaxID=2202203 RepID=UPI003CCFF4DF
MYDSETVREGKLAKALKELKATKDSKGKNDLKNAGITSIESYQKIVGSDDKSLIELRLGLKSGAKVNETQIDALLENINRNLEKATNDLKAASYRFGQEFAK